MEEIQGSKWGCNILFERENGRNELINNDKLKSDDKVHDCGILNDVHLSDANNQVVAIGGQTKRAVKKMNKMNKRKIGYDYETVAVNFLKNNGYDIIERNYHCKIGEIDIIARDKNEDSILVFVEVKYRSTKKYGSPLEAVDIRKQKKIMAVSCHYIKEKRLNFQTAVRYDVIGIIGFAGTDIHLIKNAFGSM